MHLGVAIFPTDTTLQPVDLARAVEERGFESLWFPEHSHIPVSRRTPRGGVAGAAPLPDYYWRTHDQFVALAAAAAVTSTLKLATGITLVAQRDPLWLAKEVASLDLISGGRVLFGIGYGWNKEEMADHDLQYTERRAVLRENILAMQELWTKDEAEFHGDHVDFEPSWSWPKPVQKPHPPVILGGAAGPKTIEHIVEFCDGWMPIAGRHSFGDRLDDLRLAAERAGRDPASIELGLFMAPPNASALEPLAASGIGRAVLGLPQGPPEEVLEALDSFVPLLDVVGG
ncbi:MAG: LLM class F420-dependent oxidoreductase [Acidimicrobiia bacterium]|nr:LLM class F420-dependent oxidoreductase [Acidimicrobiia bacterium]